MPAPGFVIADSSCSSGSQGEGAIGENKKVHHPSNVPPGFVPGLRSKLDEDNNSNNSNPAHHHHQQQQDLMEPHHQQPNHEDNSHGGGGGSTSSHGGVPRPNNTGHPVSSTGPPGSATSGGGGGRTSSFVNLAAVVGTGLAESMEDFQPNNNNNIQGGHPLRPPLHGGANGTILLSSQQQQQQQQRPASTSRLVGGHYQQQQQQQQQSNNTNALHDLSLARQSRHAAARLIGASPPRGDPFGFSSNSAAFLDNATTTTAPPASLSMTGMANKHLDGGMSQQQQQRGGVQGGGSSASVSGVTSDVPAAGFLTGSFAAKTAASDSGRGGGSNLDLSSSGHRLVSDFRSNNDIESILAGTSNRRSNLPSKDLGLTVMEPSEQFLEQHHYYDHDGGGGGGIASMMQQTNQSRHQQHQHQSLERPDPNTFELEQGMRRLWVDDTGNNIEYNAVINNQHHQQQQQSYLDRSIGNSSNRSGGSEVSRQIAEADIRPFCWDTRSTNAEPSRYLAVLQAHNLQIPNVRSTCEAFGVLESFRTDFADRGIIFVGYYDIRSAQYAALELEGVLKRLVRESDVVTGRNNPDVYVQYCVPLNSSSQTDESRIILSDLPPYVNEHILLPILSSYGAVRTLKKEGGHYGGASFEAEFHNVQDAKQALLELSSTQPWGPDVAVEVGMRPPVDRKRGRELLAMIGRWRHGHSGRSVQSDVSSLSASGIPYGATKVTRVQNVIDLRQGPESTAASSASALQPPEGTTTQLVLGPDGRYSYMVVNNQSGFPTPNSNYGGPPPARTHLPPQHHTSRPVEPQRQQIFHGPDGQVYITSVADPPTRTSHTTTYQSGGGGGQTSNPYWQQQNRLHQANPYQQHGTTIIDNTYPNHQDRGSAPYYTQIDPHAAIPGGHHHPPPNRHNQYSGGGMSAASGGVEDKDGKNLNLDLEAVEAGRDTRTSLMVRNIPNKYTQQMLLSEFTENGLGPGVIDFFYLPIDFKNRCNRGYAFINFANSKDILPFHRRYYGKHWSTFNSDKICDITYARIQGKAAMLKRFENSALMEKDDEYKPLVFENGLRVPFPVSGGR